MQDLEGDAAARFEVVHAALAGGTEAGSKGSGPTPPSAERLHYCGFTPQGHIWYVPPDGHGIRVLDSGTDPPHETRHDIPDVIGVVWHPGEPILAAVTQRDAKSLTLVLWDCMVRKEIARLPLTLNRRAGTIFYSVPFPMAFSRDGRFLAVCGADATVDVLDAKTGREFLRLPIGAAESVMKLGWTADHELFVKPAAEAIQFWRIEEERALRQSLELGRSANIARISPDRRWWVLTTPRDEDAAADGGPRPAVLYDRDRIAGTPLPLPDETNVMSVRFRPDSRAAVMVVDNDLVEISLPEGRELQRLAVPKRDGVAGWYEPVYLPSGTLVCRLYSTPVFQDAKTAIASPKKPKAGLTIWDVDRSHVHWENHELTGDRGMNYTCASPDGRVLVVNPNELPVGGIPGTAPQQSRKPMWVINLTEGHESLGRVAVVDESRTETLPRSISPDNRWMFVWTYSMAQGGQLTLGEMYSQIHRLPGGEVVLRRTTQTNEDDRFGGFAETIPVAAVLTDRATLELWRLDPTAELLARWQPYGGKQIATLGFTGDTLYLRSEGQTKIDLVPLPDLNRRLRTLGLGW